MQARITADGTLIVSAESELEQYALKKWNEDNKKLKRHIVIDTQGNCPVIIPTSLNFGEVKLEPGKTTAGIYHVDYEYAR